MSRRARGETAGDAGPDDGAPRTVLSAWDRELRNTGASAGYAAWFGIDPASLRGTHLRDVIGEEAFRERRDDLEAALAGEARDAERMVRTRRGERWCRVGYVPLHDATGVGGLFVVLDDISELVGVQEDLLAAQELGRMGSYVYDPDTEELSCSPQLLRILGRDPRGPSPTLEEYLAAVHPDDLALVEGLRDRAPSGGYEANYRVVRPDGSVRHVHSRTHRDPLPGRAPRRLRGVMQDETRTQLVAAELASANAVLNNVIGLVGHDLRQPVTVLAGYLDHVDSTWDNLDEEGRRHYVAVAKRVAERLVEQTRDLLAVVDRSTSSLHTRPEPVDLRAVVSAAVAMADVPVEVGPLPIEGPHADPVHVRQVLVNLLVNAGRHGAPPIEVSARLEGDEVVMEVADHGQGVASEFAPRLFDRFSRANDDPLPVVQGESASTATAGVGLGLHIVRELTRANGGTVSFRARQPHGAVFAVRLPRDR